MVDRSTLARRYRGNYRHRLGNSVRFLKMPLDVFPNFAPPQVEIQTEAPGLAPEEIESLVTFPD